MLLAGIASGVASLTACGPGRFPVTGEQLRRAVHAYHPRTLTGALEIVARWHAQGHTGEIGRLRPGSGRAEVEALLRGEGMRPTDELASLWGWHDGARGQEPFVWYHRFLSVEDAIATRRELLRNPVLRWDPRFVPVFASQDEWFAVYCDDTARVASPVFHVTAEDEPRYVFTNLSTMLVTLAEAYQQGALRWEGLSGRTVEDLPSLSRIHRQLNPFCEFPFHVPNAPR